MIFFAHKTYSRCFDDFEHIDIRPQRSGGGGGLRRKKIPFLKNIPCKKILRLVSSSLARASAELRPLQSQALCEKKSLSLLWIAVKNGRPLFSLPFFTLHLPLLYIRFRVSINSNNSSNNKAKLEIRSRGSIKKNIEYIRENAKKISRSVF